MNQKGIAPILLVIAALGIVAASGTGYVVYKKVFNKIPIPQGIKLVESPKELKEIEGKLFESDKDYKEVSARVQNALKKGSAGIPELEQMMGEFNSSGAQEDQQVFDDKEMLDAGEQPSDAGNQPSGGVTIPTEGTPQPTDNQETPAQPNPDDTEDQTLNEKQKVRQKALEYLARNPCEATMDDAIKALEITESFRLWGDDLYQELFDWAQTVIINIADERSLSDTAMSQVINSPDKFVFVRQYAEAHGPQAFSQTVRLEGQFTLMLMEMLKKAGRKDLAEQVAKKAQGLDYNIPQVCVSLWNVQADADYYMQYNDSTEAWRSSSKFNNVPVYTITRGDPLGVLGESLSNEASLQTVKWQYFDGGSWINGKIDGYAVWKLKLFNKEIETWKVSPIYLTFQMYDLTANLTWDVETIASSGQLRLYSDCDVTDLQIEGRKIKARRPFTVEHEDVNDEISCKLKFIFQPTGKKVLAKDVWRYQQ